MGKRNRPKRQKKRKAKRANRTPQPLSLAYRGNKYRTQELIETLYRAEVGIYESFVMTERKLTDHAVESALENLVLQMRRAPLADLEDTSVVDYVVGEEADLVIWNVRRNWQDLYETKPRPSRDSQIGVLRTILGSVDVWKSVSPNSRGYLRYLEGFLQKMGISIEAYSPDHQCISQPEESELLLIGRLWCHNADPEAAAEFANRAEYMIRSGEGEEVVEVCQQLIGEKPDSEAFAELARLSIQAQKSLQTAMG
jgi:hypothetical protein